MANKNATITIKTVFEKANTSAIINQLKNDKKALETAGSTNVPVNFDFNNGDFNKALKAFNSSLSKKNLSGFDFSKQMMDVIRLMSNPDMAIEEKTNELNKIAETFKLLSSTAGGLVTKQDREILKRLSSNDLSKAMEEIRKVRVAEEKDKELKEQSNRYKYTNLYDLGIGDNKVGSNRYKAFLNGKVYNRTSGAEEDDPLISQDRLAQKTTIGSFGKELGVITGKKLKTELSKSLDTETAKKLGDAVDRLVKEYKSIVEQMTPTLEAFNRLEGKTDFESMAKRAGLVKRMGALYSIAQEQEKTLKQYDNSKKANGAIGVDESKFFTKAEEGDFAEARKNIISKLGLNSFATKDINNAVKNIQDGIKDSFLLEDTPELSAAKQHYRDFITKYAEATVEKITTAATKILDSEIPQTGQSSAETGKGSQKETSNSSAEKPATENEKMVNPLYQTNLKASEIEGLKPEEVIKQTNDILDEFDKMLYPADGKVVKPPQEMLYKYKALTGRIETLYGKSTHDDEFDKIFERDERLFDDYFDLDSKKELLDKEQKKVMDEIYGAASKNKLIPLLHNSFSPLPENAEQLNHQSASSVTEEVKAGSQAAEQLAENVDKAAKSTEHTEEEFQRLNNELQKANENADNLKNAFDEVSAEKNKFEKENQNLQGKADKADELEKTIRKATGGTKKDDTNDLLANLLAAIDAEDHAVTDEEAKELLNKKGKVKKSTKAPEETTNVGLIEELQNQIETQKKEIDKLNNKLGELEGKRDEALAAIETGDRAHKEKEKAVKKYNDFARAKNSAIKAAKGNATNDNGEPITAEQYIDDHIQEFYDKGGNIDNDTHLYQLYKAGLVNERRKTWYKKQGKEAPAWEYDGKDLTALLEEAYNRGEEILQSKKEKIDRLSAFEKENGELVQKVQDYISEISELNEKLTVTEQALEKSESEKNALLASSTKEEVKSNVKSNTKSGTGSSSFNDKDATIKELKAESTAKDEQLKEANKKAASAQEEIEEANKKAEAAQREAEEANKKAANAQKEAEAAIKEAEASKKKATSTTTKKTKPTATEKTPPATTTPITESDSTTTAPATKPKGKSVIPSGSVNRSAADIQAEAAALENLCNIVNDVTNAVNEKTQAFKSENTTVSKIVNSEKAKLEELKGSLTEIKETLAGGLVPDSAEGKVGQSVEQQAKTLVEAVSKSLDKIPISFETQTALEELRAALKTVKEEKLEVNITPVTTGFKDKIEKLIKGTVKIKVAPTNVGAFSKELQKSVKATPIKVEVKPLADAFAKDLKKLANNEAAKVLGTVSNEGKNKEIDTIEVTAKTLQNEIKTLKSLSEGINRLIEKYDAKRSAELKGIVEYLTEVSSASEKAAEALSKAFSGKAIDKKAIRTAISNALNAKSIKVKVTPGTKEFMTELESLLNGRNIKMDVVPVVKNFDKLIRKSIPQSQRECKIQIKPNTNSLVAEIKRVLKKNDFQIKITGTVDEINSVTKDKQFVQKKNDKVVKVVKEEKSADSKSKKSTMADKEFVKNLRSSIDSQYKASEEIARAQINNEGRNPFTLAKYRASKDNVRMLLQQARTEGRLSEEQIEEYKGYIEEKKRSLRTHIAPDIKKAANEKKEELDFSDPNVASNVIRLKHQIENEIYRISPPRTEAQARKLGELNLRLQKAVENCEKLYEYNNHSIELKRIEEEEKAKQEETANAVDKAVTEFNKKKNSTKEIKAEYEAAEKTIKDYHDLKAKTEELKNPQSEAQAKQLGKLKLQLKEVTEAYNKLFDTKNNYIGNPFDGTNLKDSLINLNKEKASQQEEIVKTAEKASTQFYQTEKVKLKDLETLIRQYERIVDNTLSEKGKSLKIEDLFKDVIVKDKEGMPILDEKGKPKQPNEEYYRSDRSYTPMAGAIARSRLEVLTGLRNNYKDSKVQEQIVEEYKDSRDVIEKYRQKNSSYKVADKRMVSQESDRITKYLESNSKISVESQKKLAGLRELLKDTNLSAAGLRNIQKEFYDIDVAERQAGRTGHAFLDTLNTKIKYLSASILSFYFSWMGIMDFFRKGFETVKDFDSALSEMQKVSNESLDTLKEYQKTTFDLGSAVGATGIQIQQSTADWQRLGESLTEASKSAQVSNILFNVSEFSSIDEATQSLVAMSSAYEDVSKNIDKMDIVDKLNQVGKLIAQTYGNIWGYNIKYNLVDNYIG